MIQVSGDHPTRLRIWRKLATLAERGLELKVGDGIRPRIHRITNPGLCRLSYAHHEATRNGRLVPFHRTSRTAEVLQMHLFGGDELFVGQRVALNESEDRVA